MVFSGQQTGVFHLIPAAGSVNKPAVAPRNSIASVRTTNVMQPKLLIYNAAAY